MDAPSSVAVGFEDFHRTLTGPSTLLPRSLGNESLYASCCYCVARLFSG